ncbi:MAG: hypothetical protein AB3N10_10730 [Allomuricauda sp.]
MLVVKANRALLKKRRSYSDIREAYEGYASETKLQFKELTPFEQKKIRDQIIAQAKRERVKEIQLYLITFIVLSTLMLIGYLILSS